MRSYLPTASGPNFNTDPHHWSRICGCYYLAPWGNTGHLQQFGTRKYLPLVDLSAHSQILSTTCKTNLTQTFQNTSKKPLEQVKYTFPLYDGVSVVAFECVVGDKVIYGVVKEAEKAKAVFNEAVARGETAGLLEQSPASSDVFTTTIGNIPAETTVIVNLIYLGELKHDAEADGIRFTIPTSIAPRYGQIPQNLGVLDSAPTAGSKGGIKITVDVQLDDKTFIRGIQSPSHPIAVALGSVSTANDSQATPTMSQASATLTLGAVELGQDFVLVVQAKETMEPVALLENHPFLPDQRALMVSLVPKFKLPPIRPEIVFVADRSGSMTGSIDVLVKSLKVFLKSLPVGVKFNICSFGSSHTFLWPRSKAYDQSSLNEALKHLESFDANYGGTEMYAPLEATIKNRYKDIPLEIMLLTDGEIWDQQRLFYYLNKEVHASENPIRIFTLGLGNAVSHSLIEGLARAGNGFSQAVMLSEKLDGKVVRMLKGALSPHVTNYKLEVKYASDESDDEEFELIERIEDSLQISIPSTASSPSVSQQPISLFDTSADVDMDHEETEDPDGTGRYSHLPAIEDPKYIQAPHKVRPLFPFERSVTYILLGPGSAHRKPVSVILNASTVHGPLKLEIPIQTLEKPAETIHQLAARKAIGELEEGRGWIFDSKDEGGVPLKERLESQFQDMVEREAVRLGVKFQVGGKWCSFVAVEANKSQLEEKQKAAEKEAKEAEQRKKSNPYRARDMDSEGQAGSEPSQDPPAYSASSQPSHPSGPVSGARGLNLGADRAMSDASSIMSSATFISTASSVASAAQKYSPFDQDTKNKFLYNMKTHHTFSAVPQAQAAAQVAAPAGVTANPTPIVNRVDFYSNPQAGVGSAPKPFVPSSSFGSQPQPLQINNLQQSRQGLQLQQQQQQQQQMAQRPSLRMEAASSPIPASTSHRTASRARSAAAPQLSASAVSREDVQYSSQAYGAPPPAPSSPEGSAAMAEYKKQGNPIFGRKGSGSASKSESSADSWGTRVMGKAKKKKFLSISRPQKLSAQEEQDLSQDLGSAAPGGRPAFGTPASPGSTVPFGAPGPAPTPPPASSGSGQLFGVSASASSASPFGSPRPAPPQPVLSDGSSPASPPRGGGFGQPSASSGSGQLFGAPAARSSTKMFGSTIAAPPAPLPQEQMRLDSTVASDGSSVSSPMGERMQRKISPLSPKGGVKSVQRTVKSAPKANKSSALFAPQKVEPQPAEDDEDDIDMEEEIEDDFDYASPPLMAQPTGGMLKPSEVGVDFGRDARYQQPSGDGVASLYRFRSASAKESKSEIKPEDKLYQLIAMQSFEGSWAYNGKLFSVLGTVNSTAADRKLQQLAVGTAGNLPEALRWKVWATALAVAYFISKLAADEESWDLVVEKAKGWMTDALGSDRELVKEWILAASKLL